MEKKIAELMKRLECSREEALQIIADDAEIEKGAELFELTAEQKKVAKAYTQTGTRKGGKVKRERKVDEVKKSLLELLLATVENESGAKVTSRKNEAEFSFIFGDENFTVKLIKHRPPKK